MVRLHLLGDLRVELDGAVTDLASASRKARLLLAILALERRVHGRSELAGRLWPDVLEDSARVSLRTALSQLRAALGPTAGAMLRSERDGGVSLAPRSAPMSMTSRSCWRRATRRRRLSAVRPSCCPGLDDDWVLERRDDLRDRLAQGLGVAASRAEEDGELERAVHLTRRMAALDPLAETPHRELIRRLALLGDRGAALATYERFRDRLARRAPRSRRRPRPASSSRSSAPSIRPAGFPRRCHGRSGARTMFVRWPSSYVATTSGC